MATEQQHRKNNKGRQVFENLSPTPQLAKGYTLLGAMLAFFRKPETAVPPVPLPSVKTDLHTYYTQKPSIIWFGHSSYLIHTNGTNILVDPVLSGYASPFSFLTRSFKGADAYKTKDMPPIDYMVLTHNHYDHMDMGALKELAPQTKQYIIPSGVGKDLQKVQPGHEKVVELDWWQDIALSPRIKITATPARHFSGRGLKRNGSLWVSYVLEIDGYTIFIGGDSGYDTHFKEIGNKYGPFDIALLECGQYNVMWPYIHSMPEELIDEGKDLRAKVLMPVHWAKFNLSLHEWDEPIKRFVAAAEKAGYTYTTPMIGEPVVLGDHYPIGTWWLDVGK